MTKVFKFTEGTHYRRQQESHIEIQILKQSLKTFSAESKGTTPTQNLKSAVPPNFNQMPNSVDTQPENINEKSCLPHYSSSLQASDSQASWHVSPICSAHDMLPTSSLMSPQLWKVWELGLINALRKNSAFLLSVSVIKCVTLRPWIGEKKSMGAIFFLRFSMYITNHILLGLNLQWNNWIMFYLLKVVYGQCSFYGLGAGPYRD